MKKSTKKKLAWGGVIIASSVLAALWAKSRLEKAVGKTKELSDGLALVDGDNKYKIEYGDKFGTVDFTKEINGNYDNLDFESINIPYGKNRKCSVPSGSEFYIKQGEDIEIMATGDYGIPGKLITGCEKFKKKIIVGADWGKLY